LNVSKQNQEILIELLKNGNDVPVTEENKKEYVKAICDAKMTRNIEKQILAFLTGLYEVIPEECLKLLSVEELGLHLSGMPTLDGNFIYN
jgi:hypothetical protein